VGSDGVEQELACWMGERDVQRCVEEKGGSQAGMSFLYFDVFLSNSTLKLVFSEVLSPFSLLSPLPGILGGQQRSSGPGHGQHGKGPDLGERPPHRLVLIVQGLRPAAAVDAATRAPIGRPSAKQTVVTFRKDIWYALPDVSFTLEHCNDESIP
jgi:hypothetical protein